MSVVGVYSFDDGGKWSVRDVDDLNAAEGTKRVQTFTLPDSLVYLSFGGDPDPLNTGVFSSKLG